MHRERGGILTGREARAVDFQEQDTRHEPNALVAVNKRMMSFDLTAKGGSVSICHRSGRHPRISPSNVEIRAPCRPRLGDRPVRHARLVRSLLPGWFLYQE